MINTNRERFDFYIGMLIEDAVKKFNESGQHKMLEENFLYRQGMIDCIAILKEMTILA